MKSTNKHGWWLSINIGLLFILFFACIDVVLNYVLTYINIVKAFNILFLYILILNFVLLFISSIYIFYFLVKLIGNYHIIIANILNKKEKINKVLILNKITTFLKIYFSLVFILYISLFHHRLIFLNNNYFYKVYKGYLAISSIIFTFAIISIFLLKFYNNNLRKKFIKEGDFILLNTIEKQSPYIFLFSHSKIILTYRLFWFKENDKNLSFKFINNRYIFKERMSTMILTIYKENIYPDSFSLD